MKLASLCGFLLWVSSTAASEVGVTSMGEVYEENSSCGNDHELCDFWAQHGECETNPGYMHGSCRKACNTCDPNLKLVPSGWGEAQEVPDEATQRVVDETHRYMTETVFVDPAYEKVKDECKNRHKLCSQWVATGECEANPKYMILQCAAACRSCEKIDFDTRCPWDRNAPTAWKPGDVNEMFTNLTTLEEFQVYEPVIHSKPNSDIPGVPSGPWVVTLENFLTEEECDRLIQLGADQGYELSADVGEQKFDGTYEKFENSGRTSTNAWCVDACYDDPITKNVLRKIEHATGIPDEFSEYLQLLRYEPQQYYQSHHDYIEYQTERPEGVRLLTVFLYLNDVEAGGGTNFPRLGLTTIPKRGRALLWPSVRDDDPDAKDPRTQHQALPVEAGIKYGANAWIHQRDFKKPYAQGCI